MARYHVAAPGTVSNMPANLTPDYLAADARYKAERDPKRRIEALQEMLAVIPKHKAIAMARHTPTTTGTAQVKAIPTITTTIPKRIPTSIIRATITQTATSTHTPTTTR